MALAFALVISLLWIMSASAADQSFVIGCPAGKDGFVQMNKGCMDFDDLLDRRLVGSVRGLRVRTHSLPPDSGVSRSALSLSWLMPEDSQTLNGFVVELHHSPKGNSVISRKCLFISQVSSRQASDSQGRVSFECEELLTVTAGSLNVTLHSLHNNQQQTVQLESLTSVYIIHKYADIDSIYAGAAAYWSPDIVLTYMPCVSKLVASFNTAPWYNFTDYQVLLWRRDGSNEGADIRVDLQSAYAEHEFKDVAPGLYNVSVQVLDHGSGTSCLCTCNSSKQAGCNPSLQCPSWFGNKCIRSVGSYFWAETVDCDAAPIASVVTPAEQMAGIMVGSLSAIVLLLAVVAVYFARDFIRIKCFTCPYKPVKPQPHSGIYLVYLKSSHFLHELAVLHLRDLLVELTQLNISVTDQAGAAIDVAYLDELISANSECRIVIVSEDSSDLNLPEMNRIQIAHVRLPYGRMASVYHLHGAAAILWESVMVTVLQHLGISPAKVSSKYATSSSCARLRTIVQAMQPLKEFARRNERLSHDANIHFDLASSIYTRSATRTGLSTEGLSEDGSTQSLGDVDFEPGRCTNLRSRLRNLIPDPLRWGPHHRNHLCLVYCDSNPLLATAVYHLGRCLLSMCPCQVHPDPHQLITFNLNALLTQAESNTTDLMLIILCKDSSRCLPVTRDVPSNVVFACFYDLGMYGASDSDEAIIHELPSALDTVARLISEKPKRCAAEPLVQMNMLSSIMEGLIIAGWNADFDNRSSECQSLCFDPSLSQMMINGSASDQEEDGDCRSDAASVVSGFTVDSKL